MMFGVSVLALSVTRFLRMRIACLVGAVVLGALLAASGRAAEHASWPSRLFVMYQDSQFQDPITDVAEATDGRLLFASKSGVLREITPRGRLRTIADLGTGVAGIAADTRGSVLVIENTRIVRVLRSGRRTLVAGTGKAGYSGDGGPAVDARVHPARVIRGAFGSDESSGITRTKDGSIVFTDQQNNRLRRIRPDGIIETIAGTGARSYGGSSAVGDGGPALAAALAAPADVIQMRDRSLLVSDRWNNRIRRISSDGTITTIAGNGQFDAPLASLAGLPATTVPLNLPRGLAELPSGDVVFTDGYQLDRIAHDRTWHPYIARSTADFADRPMDAAETGATGITVTREGGVLFAWGSVYYLAPPQTSRTLLRIHDARVDSHRVTAYVNATRPASATLEVRNGTRVVARATRSIGTGRQRVSLRGHFGSHPYRVGVTLRNGAGATAHDELSLYLGDTLGLSYVKQLAMSHEDEVALHGCRRISRRRIDCDYRGGYYGSPYTLTFTLKTSGVIDVH